MKSLDELLKPFRGREEKPWWKPSWRVPSEEQVAVAEKAQGHRFPADYRALLLSDGPGELVGPEGRVALLPINWLDDIGQKPPSEGLQEMLFFAGDMGDYWYFFDPAGSLGRGEWAVFTVEGHLPREYAIYVARGFTDLFERVLAGEGIDFWWQASRERGER